MLSLCFFNRPLNYTLLIYTLNYVRFDLPLNLFLFSVYFFVLLIPRLGNLPHVLPNIYKNELIGPKSNPTHCYAHDSTLHGKPSLPNNRNNVVSSITLDLDKLNKWGSQNLVSFNSNKTQCCL